MINTNKKIPSYLCIFLLSFSLLTLGLYILYIPRLAEIDFFDLACDAIILLMVLIILHALSKIETPRNLCHFTTLGFTILYLSLLSDTLDEIFSPPILLKNISENFLQVIAYFLIASTSYRWIGHYESMNKKLRDLSSIDSLTGVLNRRTFMEKAQTELLRAQRYDNSLAIIFIDIDNFKNINDVHGHQAGDFVLKQSCGIISEELRATDLFCRWGGEEFLLLVPQANEASCHQLCERIRHKIEESKLQMESSETLSITISIGCSFLKRDESLETIIDRADKALYHSKEAGRNQVTSM